MPIFTQSLQVKDTDTEQEARKKMVNHIRHIQEQLEYTLMNLDSENISEIDIDKTTITGSTSGATMGSYINFTGSKGESFRAGKNPDGQFEFAVNGNGGTRVMYLTNAGEIAIVKRTSLAVDGGEW